MKGFSTIVISVILIVAIAIAWVSFIADKSSDNIDYKETIRLADQWASEGLFQRAIGKYETVINNESSLELWDKLFAAYEGRYKEDKEFISNYREALSLAIVARPEHEPYVRRLVELYLEGAKYQEAYDSILKAEKNGVTSPALEDMKLTARYATTLRGAVYEGYSESVSTAYTVINRDQYGTFTLDGSNDIYTEHPFINIVSEDGIYLMKEEKDSRLYNTEGIVLGIFKADVEDAGVFSERLISVKINGKYAYYDEFAKKQFGDYDWAGAFKDGLAPAIQNGNWIVINKNGEKVSDFSDIIVTPTGFLTGGNVFVAAKKANQYALYDMKMNPVGQFVCEAADAAVSDGLVAFMSKDKWGFVDQTGNVVIKPQYEDANSFSNGIAAVCANGEWGFIDSVNRLVIPCEYTDAGYFNDEGVCMVRTDDPNADEIKDPLLDFDFVEVTEPTENTEATEGDASTENAEDPEQEEEEYVESWQALSLRLGIVEE